MRTFYTLSAAQALSSLGSAMTNIAVGIWIFQQTGNATPVLLITLFAGLPQMIGGAFTGPIIDRWPRRHVLVLADTGQAVCTLLLIAALSINRLEQWHLYTIAFLQGAFGMVQTPTMLALIAASIPAYRREYANSIQQLAGRLISIAAPSLAGLLFGFSGLIIILVIDFATFILAVIVTMRLVPITDHALGTNSRGEGSIWSDVLEGIQYLINQRGLLWLILHGTIINFFLSAVLGLTTPYVLTINGNELTLGLVLTMLNAGPVLGAIVIAFWGGTSPRIHTIMPAILMISLGVMLFGLAIAPVLLVLGAFFMLFPMPMVTILIPAIIQDQVPPNLHGRVFAIVFQLASLANPLSLLLTGTLVDHVLEPATDMPIWVWVTPLVGDEAGAGMRLLIFSAGVAMFVITTCFYALPIIRRIEKPASAELV